MKNVDIGLIWAKFINIWSQISIVMSVANTFMLVVMFYVTTIRPETGIQPWFYILLIVVVGGSAVAFVLKWGISGYYRFFNQQSALSEVKRMLHEIQEQLKRIEEGEE